MKKLFLILLLGIALSQSSSAKTHASIEKVVKSSFSDVTAVDAKQLILTKTQYAAIQKRAPYVDVVFGPQTIHRLPEMISGVSETHKKVVDISFPEIEKFDCMPEPKADGPSAFVSIMLDDELDYNQKISKMQQLALDIKEQINE